MRKLLYSVLVAPLLFLNAEHFGEEVDAFSQEIVGTNDFFISEFDSEAKSVERISEAQEENLLSVNKSKKNGLYFFLPIGGISQFFLPGASFRHYFGKSFLEASYFNKKMGDIVVTHYDRPYKNSKEKLGAIYENMVIGSYGLRFKMRYTDPYFLVGTGLCFPYTEYNGDASFSFLPAITTAVGLGFTYGFVDLAISYFPIKWKCEFTYEEPEGEVTFGKTWRLLSNLRVGLGLPF